MKSALKWPEVAIQILFSMRWGARLLGGQQQSEVNCKRSVYNVKQRSSYPFTSNLENFDGFSGVPCSLLSPVTVSSGVWYFTVPAWTHVHQDSKTVCSWQPLKLHGGSSGFQERRKGKQAVKKQRMSITLSPDHPGLPWWLSGICPCEDEVWRLCSCLGCRISGNTRNWWGWGGLAAGGAGNMML